MRVLSRAFVAFAVLTICSSARADLKELVQKLPEPVQDAMDGISAAHRPSAELMRGPLRLQRTRIASGTSWLPTSSPMYGMMADLSKNWGFMFRGNIFAGYAAFNSDRKKHHFVSTNTLLFMAFGEYGKHELMPRVALSWEPFTNGAPYPSLLQTHTESYRKPVHDAQPSQELMSEVSFTYTLAIQGSALQLYVAAAGEPALGPPAYNYRVSSFSDPMPPITQRILEAGSWFGVVTAGYFLRSMKVEVSAFNAYKTPRRGYDLELRAPRSFATRVSWNPLRSWNGQLSYGLYRGFYEKELGSRVHKLIGSITYNHRIAVEANWASTVAFGGRHDSLEGWLPAMMMESTYNIEGHHTVFGRIEAEQSSLFALGLEGGKNMLLGNLALGYAYYFRPMASLAPGLGVRGSLGMLDSELREVYGTRAPVGVMAYAQIRPAAMAVQAD